MLLANLLATPEAHDRLLAASAPDDPVAGEARAFRAISGETMATLARVTQQADALAAAAGVARAGSFARLAARAAVA